MTAPARRWLHDAVVAGFPPELLVPVAPPTASLKYLDADALGKVPARWCQDKDGDWCWRPLYRWEQGCGDDDWGRSCDAGANVGLRMGTASAAGQFVFVDVDTVVDDDGPKTALAEAFTAKVLEVLAGLWGPLWVRRTRRGRAGVLVRLPAGVDPGAKIAPVYSHPDRGRVAKIEVLTRGQQAVVGGVHQSGTEISWYRVDTGVVAEFPDPADVVVVESFDAVVAAVAAVTAALAGYGIVAATRAPRASGAHGQATAAPSAQALVELLEALPHDHRVQRGAESSFANYVSVMIAVAGCVQAGGVTGPDLEQVVTAAVNWACRWQSVDGVGTDYVTERTKWDQDWSQRQQIGLGWDYLVRAASDLGIDCFRVATAVAEFSDVELETAPVIEVPAPAAVRVDVWVGDDNGATAREIAAALSLAGHAYRLDGRLVAVDLTDGCKIKPMRAVDLPHIADSICRILKQTKAGSAVTTMPRDVRDLVLTAPGVRRLVGLAAAPILAEGGVIRTAPGYDPETQLYVLPLPDVAVPDRVTRKQAEGALMTLRRALRSFPFAGSETVEDAEVGVPAVDTRLPPGAAESAALVSLLTAVCRPSLPLAPAFMVVGPRGSGSGAGKGLLVRAIAAIALGTVPGAFNAGANTEEMEKRLVSDLREANPMVLLDNVNDTALTSPLLASAITEYPVKIRPLTTSTMETLSARPWIAVTGNALVASEDLVRRFIICSLDARCEDPSTRPFRVGATDFLRGVQGARGELLSAALAIWKWGQQAEGVARGLPLGSFEVWTRWCRDPLVALGCQDVVAQIADAKARDPQRMQMEDTFLQWWLVHGDSYVRASEVADGLRLLIDPAGRSRQSFAAALGRLRGTMCGGWRMAATDGSKARKEGASFQLQWVGDGEAPPRPEPHASGFPLLTLIAGGRA